MCLTGPVSGCQVADHPGNGISTAGGELESIIGGQQTLFGRWQGVVALLGDGGEFCSGALVHPRVVVTAGHCVLFPDGDVDLVFHPEQLQVLAGANVLVDAGASLVSSVEDIEVHFTWSGGLYDPSEHDVAAILLSEEATGLELYAVRVEPFPEVGDPGVIVGYGPDGADGVGIHRDGEVEVTDVDQRLVYVGGDAGACPGDSGGPLFTEQGEGWVLSGVASLANCEQPATTAETNLVTVREWLDFVLEQWTGDNLITPDGGLEPDAGSDGGDDAGVDGGDGGFTIRASGEACSCDVVGRGTDRSGLGSILGLL
ncbi:MAG: trypsin-like serine protease [Deltaproteobacteria bacterium]|nr:trypsin-like serine protease [Deltaproteobacteria bacterium]